MGQTGTCDERIVISAEQLEPDYDDAVTHADLAAVLEDSEPVPVSAYEDIDPRGSDAFGF